MPWVRVLNSVISYGMRGGRAKRSAAPGAGGTKGHQPERAGARAAARTIVWEAVQAGKGAAIPLSSRRLKEGCLPCAPCGIRLSGVRAQCQSERQSERRSKLSA